ncbi:hypothetical protein [Glaciimonas soli]|uniref:Uncharacterized protein n=1 Tax=Glaciimonas soli TaxID=2590999 RepID=A0A843YJ60_9BURK|nr:hypothetical protein [Glaciimonas soli]MQQ99818.1 hypothetical protein [Glaciimonas soli]
MNRINALRVLLVLIGIAFMVKGAYFFTRQQYDQLLFLSCGVAWAVWITNAVFKNWNLPAPFAYNQGENQIGRVTYCIVVVGIFFFVIFS